MEILTHMKNCEIQALHTTGFCLVMQQFEVQRRYFQHEFEIEDYEFLKQRFFYRFRFSMIILEFGSNKWN